MSGFPVPASNIMRFDRASSGRNLPGDFNMIIEILAGVERYRNIIDRPVF